MNWMESKLKISCLGLITGILTIVLDIIPDFGELQIMLIVVVLLLTSFYSGIINSKIGILGSVSVWICIPVERCILLLYSAGTLSEYIQLMNFSIISLLLCLSGFFCVVMARRLSQVKKKFQP